MEEIGVSQGDIHSPMNTVSVNVSSLASLGELMRMQVPAISQVGKPGDNMGVALRKNCPLHLRQGLLLAWSSHAGLGWLASEPQKSHPFPSASSPQCWNYRCMSPHLDLAWPTTHAGSGDQTQGLMLISMRQAPHWVEHSATPPSSFRVSFFNILGL